MDNPERMLSMHEAAKRLCIGRSSVYRLAAAGRIPVVKLGRRTLVRESSIAALIDSLEPYVPGEAPVGLRH